jgi:hypothetical protein
MLCENFAMMADAEIMARILLGNPLIELAPIRIPLQAPSKVER